MNNIKGHTKRKKILKEVEKELKIHRGIFIQGKISFNYLDMYISFLLSALSLLFVNSLIIGHLRNAREIIQFMKGNFYL